MNLAAGSFRESQVGAACSAPSGVVQGVFHRASSAPPLHEGTIVQRSDSPQKRSRVGMNRDWVRRWNKAYPEKRAAHKKVESAIRAGKLKRQPCVRCGNPKSQAHHDDYGKPLEVMWLCRAHHRERHIEIGKPMGGPHKTVRRDSRRPDKLPPSHGEARAPASSVQVSLFNSPGGLSRVPPGAFSRRRA